MKKLMVLGASILQLPAIQIARELGYEVIAVDMNPEAIGFKWASKQYVISTIDIPAVLDVAKEEAIDGVITLASDMPVRTIAAVSKELGLVGISEEAAINTTDKGKMREALKKAQVAIPMFFPVTTFEACKEALQKVIEAGHRCIIKPSDNSGSRGIHLIESFDETSLQEVFAYTQSFARGGTVLVEEYMEGPEVSVETFSVNGHCHVVQVTDKVTTGAPYFVEMGHSQPSLLGDVVEDIKTLAQEAVIALGVLDGPAHVEIKVTSSGPKIVELGARIGGDNISTHLVPLSTGVDLVKACIDYALGNSVSLDPVWHKASAIRYIPQQEGQIFSVTGVEEAKALPGIQEAVVLHEAGHRIAPVKSSTDRIGYVIATADTVKDAVACCDQALQTIKIEVGS